MDWCMKFGLKIVKFKRIFRVKIPTVCQLYSRIFLLEEFTIYLFNLHQKKVPFLEGKCDFSLNENQTFDRHCMSHTFQSIRFLSGSTTTLFSWGIAQQY